MFERFFSSDFMPHGYCYQWQSDIVWLHAGSDGLIALSYYAIPFLLIYFLSKRRDIEFPAMFVMFGAFILLCGTTHLLEIWSIWNGTYVFTGTVKAVTGVVSATTAVMLFLAVPRALTIPSPRQLEEINASLRAEIEARRRWEAEQERLLKEVQAERDKLETAEHQLAEANEALRVRNRDLQEFAYVASHDLQEPLRKIIAFSDLLREDCIEQLDETGELYVDRIQNASARMSQLLSDLLTYSRVTTYSDRFQMVDLNAILQDTVADLELAIAEADADVSLGDLPTVKADPLQMHQLFNNLVSNAIKYVRDEAPPAVRIAVESEDDSGVTIVVEDNGKGFAPKYADRIFAPFERLEGRRYGGTGMGLAICRRIVERHGGSIRAEGMPGTGARFFISLPKVPPTDQPLHERNDV